MCYNKADEMLKAVEARWVNADAAINFLEMGKSLEFWTEKAHNQLDAMLDYINMREEDVCCFDIYLRLEADIEKMTATYRMLTRGQTELKAV